MPTPKETLAELERPHQRHENANADHSTLLNMQAPHPEMQALRERLLAPSLERLEGAAADLSAHRSQHGAQLQRKIDVAAQAVLDERGEVHSDHPDYKAPEGANA